MKVLVVEDNERNLKLARDVLEHAGLSVAGAGSGEDAMALAADADVILMDIGLPGMSGVETLAALRAAGIGAPVAAFTAYAMAGDRDRLLAAGFDGYVEKPVDVRTLADQVRALARS